MKTEKKDLRQHLADVLRELLNEKPFSKIRMDDIVSRAGLSRQSFYRYFYDKYDLLFYMYENDVCCLRKQYATNDITGLGADIIAYLKENAYIYRNLGCDFTAPNPFMNHWFAYSRQHLIDNIGERNLTAEIDTAITFYLHACYFIHYEYMLNHIKGTPEEICRITNKNMPDILKPFFE